GLLFGREPGKRQNSEEDLASFHLPVEEPKRILIEWPAYDGTTTTTVEWIFTGWHPLRPVQTTRHSSASPTPQLSAL
ncbi:MAG TPA: hypothetical protein VH164_04770, partial [Ktedonobacteraceae bacterium]|nr:hypothetical protein [Ktedonobacteraceae bacterium]